MSSDSLTDIALCAAASAAYAQPSTLAVSDVHVVISEVDGIRVVAFRGTVPTSWQDWFRDFAAWPTHVMDHLSLGCCHDGFVTGAEAILPQLRAMLNGPYVLTGHSLGGALAIAAGALLTDCGCPPLKLTTFGAPRVGMGDLAKVLKGIPGTRWRHGADPVPEVPSWPYLADRLLTPVGAANHLDPIGDHAISRYAMALATAAEAHQ